MNLIMLNIIKFKNSNILSSFLSNDSGYVPYFLLVKMFLIII